MSAPAGARAFLHVRVTPRSSRTTLARDAGGAVRARLTAAPVDGNANDALVTLLAARLELPKSAFELTRGARGRDKVVCVHGLSPGELERRLVAALPHDVDKGSRRG